MYGIIDGTFKDKMVACVQEFWPGAEFKDLAFGADDEAIQLSFDNMLPIVVLLANYRNDERAALAVHPNGNFYAQKLNKDTLTDEYSAFMEATELKFLEEKL